MSESELIGQLSRVQEKGFDRAFMEFCAGVFSSHAYNAEGLPAARMYGAYLRLAIGELTAPCSRRELLEEKEGGGNLETAFVEISRESWKEALLSERPFCELFVEKWCRRFAEG